LNSSQIEEWKTCFLPIEKSPEGGLAQSSCKIMIPGKFNFIFIFITIFINESLVVYLLTRGENMGNKK
jgi:hypothetical protein